MADEPPVTQLNKRERLTVDQLNELGQSDSDRPVHGLTEIVQMTGVSRSTIKRKLSAGEFPNAVRDEHGAWLLSISDLLAAGLTLVHEPAPSPATQQVLRVSDPAQPQTVNQPSRVAELERELVQAQAAVALERVRREAAEELTREVRQRVIAEEKRADLAERSLRMLTAGERLADSPAATTEAPQVAVEPPARTSGTNTHAQTSQPTQDTTSAVPAPGEPVDTGRRVSWWPWSRHR